MRSVIQAVFLDQKLTTQSARMPGIAGFVICIPTALAAGCRMSERILFMALPPIAFYSIYEISARWGCHPADVAGWAAAGHFQVLAGIPPVSCGDETVAGLVEVPIAELMPMFRRYGPSDELCRLKRVLPLGNKSWLKVRAAISIRQTHATQHLALSNAI